MLDSLEKGAVLQGRPVDFFRHRAGAEFGYETPRWDAFALLHPANEEPGKVYPLVVVFHSAGHDLYSVLSCTLYEGNHDIYHVPRSMFGLYLDCREHESTDWWWGGINARGEGDPAWSGTGTQPVENRCIRTLEWTLDSFPIDRSRVYAVGNSMGGSGALGVALSRGDLFAAIKANVPAGVRHAADRCCLDLPAPDGFSIPDPPVVIDYSAQNDSWSEGHEILYRGMREHRYSLIGFWGPFGHENNNERIRQFNDLVHSVDLYSFSTKEAYPVFTDASTDDPIPWPDGRDSTESGQVNGFFRWSILEDTETRFSVSLRLLAPGEWETRVALPKESVADLTFRRMQRFLLAPGEAFRYSYGDQTGCGVATADGRPEWSRIRITREPTVLTVVR